MRRVGSFIKNSRWHTVPNTIPDHCLDTYSFIHNDRSFIVSYPFPRPLPSSVHLVVKKLFVYVSYETLMYSPMTLTKNPPVLLEGFSLRDLGLFIFVDWSLWSSPSLTCKTRLVWRKGLRVYVTSCSWTEQDTLTFTRRTNLEPYVPSLANVHSNLSIPSPVKYFPNRTARFLIFHVWLPLPYPSPPTVPYYISVNLNCY